jgi:hypothetical protein
MHVLSIQCARRGVSDLKPAVRARAERDLVAP